MRLGQHPEPTDGIDRKKRAQKETRQTETHREEGGNAREDHTRGRVSLGHRYQSRSLG